MFELAYVYVQSTQLVERGLLYPHYGLCMYVQYVRYVRMPTLTVCFACMYVCMYVCMLNPATKGGKQRISYPNDLSTCHVLVTLDSEQSFKIHISLDHVHAFRQHIK